MSSTREIDREASRSIYTERGMRETKDVMKSRERDFTQTIPLLDDTGSQCYRSYYDVTKSFIYSLILTKTADDTVSTIALVSIERKLRVSRFNVIRRIRPESEEKVVKGKIVVIYVM